VVVLLQDCQASQHESDKGHVLQGLPDKVLTSNRTVIAPGDGSDKCQIAELVQKHPGIHGLARFHCPSSEHPAGSRRDIPQLRPLGEDRIA
jgi:hypothetical protein